MPGDKKEMVSLAEALAVNGLEDGFRTRALAGATGAELLAWCKSQLRDTPVFYPSNLRYLRASLDCSGSHGGKREARGPRLLRKTTGVRHMPSYIKHSC